MEKILRRNAKLVDITIFEDCNLEAYESIPIVFEVRSRLDLDELVASRGQGFLEHAVDPWWKDYDQCEEDRPSVLLSRFDSQSWGVLAAFHNGRRVGGAIIAWKSREFDMLQGRDDLAVVADLRVHPDWRGMGVGRKLFDAAVSWARERHCKGLHVETQDTNVAACRFYSAMGCELLSAAPKGYGDLIDEAKLVWCLCLKAKNADKPP